jgi:branched-subunit amino acid transport protein AzlD
MKLTTVINPAILVATGVAASFAYENIQPQSLKSLAVFVSIGLILMLTDYTLKKLSLDKKEIRMETGVWLIIALILGPVALSLIMDVFGAGV